MSKFTLTWRIILAVGVAILTGVAASGSLLWQLRNTSAAYDALLGQTDVQCQDRARVMQVDFKKQVQEWKNLLLRGHNFEDFQKYQASFKKEEASVRAGAQALVADVTDPVALKEIQTFLAAHDAMGKSYDSAIQAFSLNKGQDFAAADAMVKGIDRAPTDSIDAIVDRLRAVVADVREVQLAQVRSRMIHQRLSSRRLRAIVAGCSDDSRRVSRYGTGDAPAETAEATTAAGQSRSARSLSHSATEQAASLERRRHRWKNGVDDAFERGKLPGGCRVSGDVDGRVGNRTPRWTAWSPP